VNKGWSSYSDELSNQMYSIEETVKKIEIDDIVKLYENNTKLINIEINEQNTVVYNLQDIENNHNFFANNVLVHNRFCFIAGTQITMADGSFKNIEEVQIGDEVITLNEETKLNEVKKVINTKSPIHNDLVKYTLSNGVEVTSTFDHPFYVNKMELASYAPNLTNERYELGVNVRKIETGDFVYMIPNDNEVTIEKIEPQPLKDTQTYIFAVEDNHNFYANGILTHNKV
jgi:intein/homing endonuclease